MYSNLPAEPPDWSARTGPKPRSYPPATRPSALVITGWVVAGVLVLAGVLAAFTPLIVITAPLAGLVVAVTMLVDHLRR